MIGILTVGGESGFTDDGTGHEGDYYGKYYTYRNKFSPAPWTFAIWFPIFIGNFTTAFQYWKHRRCLNSTSLLSMAPPYCLALMLNASTPFIPIGYDFGICFLLFLSLCWTLQRMYNPTSEKLAAKWAVRTPVVMFWTWAGVATVVSGAQAYVGLSQAGNDVISSEMSSALLLCINFALVVLGYILVDNVEIFASTGVLAWANVGVAFEQREADGFLSSVSRTAISLALCVIVFAVAKQASRWTGSDKKLKSG